MTKALNERLAPLILMLSSPVDGEVVAAARAIERVLKAGGHTWHDLAAVLTATERRAEPPRKEKRNIQWREAVKELLRNNPDDLSDWDRKFLRSILGFTNISSKQAETLRRILEKFYDFEEAA